MVFTKDQDIAFFLSHNFNRNRSRRNERAVQRRLRFFLTKRIVFFRKRTANRMKRIVFCLVNAALPLKGGVFHVTTTR